MTSRPFPGRAAGDNSSPFTVTEMTLMAFGPSLIGAIVICTLLLVKVW